MRTHPIPAERIPEFIELAFTLNAADPLWVPPLRAPLEAELSGRSAFARTGRHRLFLCEDAAGRPLGRVGAIVNERLRDEAGAPLGQMGYFESVDDPEVARSLFAAAGEWLRAEGARRALGPMNGGAHRLHRLMIAGFERTPFLFEPRNPRHYPALFEAAGWRIAHRWHSFDVSEADLRAITAFLDAGGAPAVSSGRWRIEVLDTSDPGRALARLHPLLDGFWTGHLGYAPLALDEFGEAFGGLLALITSRHIGLLVDAESGRDVGCAFMYPDYVDEMRALRGDVRGYGAWLAAGKRPRRLVLHTLATLPEARRTGAPYTMVRQGIANALEDGYETLLVGMVDEDFRLFRKVAEPTREYALFKKDL